MKIPNGGVADFVEKLAAQHGVTGEMDRIDRMASTFTRLSGDDVELDRIERLLVSLGRKGILDLEDIFALEEQYLDHEKDKETPHE
ncbi:hypothetical protein [Pseudomonas putida]|uniref:hypothetical protein n=1 Tax=Pseudomonas putida TaxID=303 RepID=UPI000EF74F84|nr:hypothetical protein [Pseudomonas putida]AYN11768.1 hypothetical protein CHN49_18600 [Pseudomonas putida]